MNNETEKMTNDLSTEDTSTVVFDDTTTEAKAPKKKTVTKKETNPNQPAKRTLKWSNGYEKKITLNCKYGNSTFSITKNGGISIDSTVINPFEEVESIRFSNNCIYIFQKNDYHFIVLKSFQKKTIARVADILRQNGILVLDDKKSWVGENSFVINNSIASLVYDGITLKHITCVKKAFKNSPTDTTYVPVCSTIDLKSNTLRCEKNYSSICYKKNNNIYFFVRFFDRGLFKRAISMLEQKGDKIKRGFGE